VALMFAATTAETPAVCTAKVSAMPDFCQVDEDGHFDNGGKVFCGPVAVSNSLVWLSQNGFPKMLPPVEKKGDPDNVNGNGGNGSAEGDHKIDSQKSAQIELIRTLGSPDFMGTEGHDGTSATRLIRGLGKYVADHGYKVDHVEYRGWSNV